MSSRAECSPPEAELESLGPGDDRSVVGWWSDARTAAVSPAQTPRMLDKTVFGRTSSHYGYFYFFHFCYICIY